MLFFGKKAVTLHRDLKTTLITYNNIMYTYKYPHPAVTTDCVVFGFDGNSLSLLLIKRGIEPYKGTWALPGGFMNMDETAEQGALRELQEETGVKDIYIEQLQAFTGVDRDPRERVLTIAFLAFVRQESMRLLLVMMQHRLNGSRFQNFLNLLLTIRRLSVLHWKNFVGRLLMSLWHSVFLTRLSQ